MSTKIVNTSSINGPATDFTSLYPSIMVDVYGNAIDAFGLPSYNTIDCGKTIVIPANQNLLWTDQLIVCGTLDIRGRLVQIQ